MRKGSQFGSLFMTHNHHCYMKKLLCDLEGISNAHINSHWGGNVFTFRNFNF